MTNRTGIGPEPVWQPRELLDGVRVTDFSRNVAGAYVTRLLGDMGAEVIKIEAPHEGDPSRALTRPVISKKYRMGGFFVMANCSKKGLSLDLTRPEAKEIVYEMVRVSDVVVENFAPGAIERLGFGYEALRQVNPTIIMCSVSGFGQYGPYRGRRATEKQIEASTGLLDTTGSPRSSPHFLGQSLCDFVTALHGALGICATLFFRRQTGIGQYLDIAMHDSAFACNDLHIPWYIHTSGGVKTTRNGRFFKNYAVQGIFRGRDGWLVIQATSDFSFKNLADAMGKPELASPEEFGVEETRLDPRKTGRLYKIIEDWVQSFSTVREVDAFLHEHRVLSFLVLPIEKVVNDPNTKERGLLARLPDSRVGALTIQNTAFKFSRTPTYIHSTPPRIGEHSEEVLGDLLGRTPQEVAQLFLKEAIWAEEEVQPKLLAGL